MRSEARSRDRPGRCAGRLVGVGAGSALVLARSLEAWDPWTYAAGATLLLAVALLAAWLPARAATRVDPVTVLRAE